VGKMPDRKGEHGEEATNCAIGNAGKPAKQKMQFAISASAGIRKTHQISAF